MKPDVLASPARVHANLALAGSAAAMMSGTIFASACGFGYWWLAARMLSREAVGAASAALAAINVLALLSECGLGTSLMERLPGQRKPSETLASALLLGGGVAVASALSALALATGVTGRTYAPVPWTWALFACGVAATTLSSIADQACYGLMRPMLPFERNTTFSLGKLALLPLLALILPSLPGQVVVLCSWIAASAAGLAWMALRAGISPTRARCARLTTLRGLTARLVGHHALNLATTAPAVLMPLLASAILGTSEGGAFYIAWLLAGFTFLIPAALTSMLVTVGRADPVDRMARFRFSLSASLALAVASSVSVAASSSFALSFFGERYAGTAAAGLVVLGAAALPCSIRHHFIAVRRFRGTMASAAGWFVLAGFIELAAAVAGGLNGGLAGFCIGWLAAVTLQACAMLPAVIEEFRRGATSRLGIHPRELAKGGAEQRPPSAMEDLRLRHLGLEQ